MRKFVEWLFVLAVCLILWLGLVSLWDMAWKVAHAYSDDQIVNAIYLAEGGSKTSHPYGILAHYRHTTPRQACFNTVRHARKDWNGKGDFILFLQKRYAPLNVANDPTGLNRNWYKNVMYFLRRDNHV